jgi:hypothetical protein
MTQVAKLTIDNTKVAGDLTDYPVYVNLADMPSTFWDTVANGGGDIRIYKSDGTTELAREVVSCDTSTETGELHFKYTGTLSGSTDTEVQIHADGTSADYAVTDTYGRNNVWGSIFAGVYHLQSNASDSTANGRNLTTVTGAPSTTTGKIGGGISLNGSSSYSGTQIDPDSYNAGLSLSCWVKLNARDVGEDIIGFNESGSWGGVVIQQNTAGSGVWYYRFGTSVVGNGYTTDDDTSTDWQLLHITKAGTSDKLYLQGTNVDSRTGGTLTNNSTTFGIGDTSLGNPMTGLLDEVRVYTTELSANWITTEYNNQNSPSTFYTAEVPFITLNITDTLSLTETSTHLRNRVSNITDNLNLTENISLLKVMFLNIVDTLHLDDLVSGVRDMLLTVTDALHITDSSNVKFKWTKQDKPTSTFTSQTKPTSIWTDQTKD